MSDAEPVQPVIAERIELGLDVARLVEQFERDVRPLPPAWYVDDVYGGWSVLSETGDYRDLFRVNWVSELWFNEPTVLCTGYVKDVLRQLTELGLVPHRLRFMLLTPGHRTSVHQDAPDGDYRVRLHIPLLTNPNAKFATGEGSVHLPADGAGYLVNVARLHSAGNQGVTERVHLVCGIRDTLHVSHHHRYEAPLPHMDPAETPLSAAYFAQLEAKWHCACCPRRPAPGATSSSIDVM